MARSRPARLLPCPCCAAHVLLMGSNITGSRDLILLRQQGRHLAAELLSSGCRGCGSGASEPGSQLGSSSSPAEPPAKRLCAAPAPLNSSGGCSWEVQQWQQQEGMEQEWLLIKPLGTLPGEATTVVVFRHAAPLASPLHRLLHLRYADCMALSPLPFPPQCLQAALKWRCSGAAC